MSIQLGPEGTIELEGHCPAEDAEVLLRHLATLPNAPIDWRSCDYAHTAVVQILLASDAELVGPPRGAFLRDMIHPSLTR